MCSLRAAESGTPSHCVHHGLFPRHYSLVTDYAFLMFSSLCHYVRLVTRAWMRAEDRRKAGRGLSSLQDSTQTASPSSRGRGGTEVALRGLAGLINNGLLRPCVMPCEQQTASYWRDACSFTKRDSQSPACVPSPLSPLFLMLRQLLEGHRQTQKRLRA